MKDGIQKLYLEYIQIGFNVNWVSENIAHRADMGIGYSNLPIDKLYLNIPAGAIFRFYLTELLI